ncbi:MAG: cupin domain-containing protein [Candidatus Dormibacteraeota bacterium]|uniref:Cupin domain-containing protein n=1 Tax=Candidatus Dormiibacter inghamiae TaxID=3127013 RepID=A0A934KAK8_9BACT|nr:cupin domain-containing protein [Candidatus Dormibacteraeota bacterium]MBJ7605570.1 cupin domain-containing protein [Candidatus Dormibacteraeota bacterium]
MTQTIVNPITGYTMTFLEATEEFFRFSETGQPDAPAPALHVHPLQEERFQVTRGTVAFVMNDQEVVCQPGEGVAVPAGVPHTFHNAGEGEFEMLGEYRPGLPEKSRRFHEVYFALARAGLTDVKGMPSLWQVAVEMPLFSDHVRLASPPWALQRALLALLRPIARLRGCKPYRLDPSVVC